MLFIFLLSGGLMGFILVFVCLVSFKYRTTSLYSRPEILDFCVTVSLWFGETVYLHIYN